MVTLFSVWICPTFIGSSSNGSLVFRALAMLFWSVSYLWYCWSWCLQRQKVPVDSWCCWAHLKVGGGGYRSHWACLFLCHWQRSRRCRTLLMLPYWMNWSVSQCPGCEVEARTARAFLLLLLADQSLGLLAATAAGWWNFSWDPGCGIGAGDPSRSVELPCFCSFGWREQNYLGFVCLCMCVYTC